MALSDRIRPGVEVAAWVIPEVMTLEADNAKLREELAAAQADAARLDYLQQRQATVHLSAGKDDFDFVVGGLWRTKNSSIRAAIDAAIAKEKAE